MGDMNARIGTRREGEEEHMGTHFFDEDSERSNVQSEEVRDNRERLVSLRMENDLRIMNTTFQTQDQYLATYKEKRRTTKEDHRTKDPTTK